MIFSEMALFAVIVASFNMATARIPLGDVELLPKKKGSPKKMKQDRVQIRVASTKQAKRVAYMFRILKLAADIEIIWCNKTPFDDAYLHPLYKSIEEHNSFSDEDVIAVVRRRISRANNDIQYNRNDSYPRHMIVRTVEESTTESRMAILMLFREFMMRPEHNRFGYDYLLVSEHSDLTPLNPTLLEPANAYIPDTSILNITTAIYEKDDDTTWYQNNQEIASDFFPDRPFPMYAVEMLGFPKVGNDDDNNPLAHGFNPPDDP
jgi:hypothetical protein